MCHAKWRSGPSNVFITQIGIGLFEKAKEASLGRSGGRKKPYKDISRNSSSALQPSRLALSTTGQKSCNNNLDNDVIEFLLSLCTIGEIFVERTFKTELKGGSEGNKDKRSILINWTIQICSLVQSKSVVFENTLARCLLVGQPKLYSSN